MLFQPTTIPDVLIVKPTIYSDERGFFFETYQSQRFSRAGIRVNFVQDNHSGSMKGTLRGLHYQIQQAQGKLVRVISGEIFDVAVDLRQSSPTFGQWVGVHLSAENKLQAWIPVGFAHGFYVVSEWADVIYKVSDFYAPQWERTLLWNDPSINIEWPLIEPPLLSSKDSQGSTLENTAYFD